MKNYKSLSLLFVLPLFVSINLFSQIAIGTETMHRSIPIDPYYGYSYTQTIYLASEIGTSGNITSLTYYPTATTVIDNSNDWIVYIGHTSKTNFISLDWVPIDSLITSFTGVVTVVGGEVKIILDTPFAYNGTSNLVIAVEDNKTSYNTSNDYFYASDSDPARSIGITSDSFDPNPINAIGMGFTENSIANITIDMSTTGITKTTKNSLFNIYPNPNGGFFTINNHSKENVVINVTNIQGELIYSTNSVNSILTVDLSENAKGIYFVSVTSNNENETFKILTQ